MTSARDVDEMLADLTRTLWQQRRLLERVRYHMKVQELILAGTDDWMLTFAVNDVEGLLRAASEVEAARVEITQDLASGQWEAVTTVEGSGRHEVIEMPTTEQAQAYLRVREVSGVME